MSQFNADIAGILEVIAVAAGFVLLHFGKRDDATLMLKVAALILIVVGTAFNIVAVIVFNLLSSMLGGLQVVTQDRPTRRQLRRAAR